MPRCIDADALLNNLPNDLPYKASVKRVLIQAPTVDVVPRSEIDKFLNEVNKLINEYLQCAEHTQEFRLLLSEFENKYL